MNAIKQQAIEKFNRAIADLERERNLVGLLPDALLEMQGVTLLAAGYALRVDIPATATALRDARQRLGRDWKRGGDFHEYQSDDGNRFFLLHPQSHGCALEAGHSG